MAIVKYNKDGYGQIELNHVAWRRDGRIEAQCHLDADVDFATEPAENGMLLAVDRATRTVYKATTALAAYLPIGVNYSTERIYDERQVGGLKYFKTEAKDDFLPRIGYQDTGDIFTTNCIAYDDGMFADDDALVAHDLEATPLWAGIDDAMPAYWVISAAAPTAGPVARVVELTTMPDGQFAVKLHIYKG